MFRVTCWLVSLLIVAVKLLCCTGFGYRLRVIWLSASLPHCSLTSASVSSFAEPV